MKQSFPVQTRDRKEDPHMHTLTTVSHTALLSQDFASKVLVGVFMPEGLLCCNYLGFLSRKTIFACDIIFLMYLCISNDCSPLKKIKGKKRILS